MKRSLLMMVLIAAVAFAQAPASVEGDWQGNLSAGPATLRVLFHIVKGTDGIYLGELESLDQGVTIPIDRVQVTGQTVRFELRRVNGTFEGTLGPDGRLKGTWTQGASAPLELTRVAAPAAAAGPATPPPDLLADIMKSVGVPMDIEVPVSPTPVPGPGGNLIIGYELHLTNASPVDLHISRIEVFNGDTSLVAYEGAELNGILQRIGPDATDRRTLGPGLRVVAFVWPRFNARAAVPRTLRNRVTVDGFSVESTVNVSTVSPVVLGAPLRGSNWMAGNGPSNTSIHRRALMPIEGRLHISQRFATDWVKVDDSGKTFSGDPKDNKTHFAYGSDALAVADATVAAVKDGIPENIPGPDSRAVPITLETVGGNHVILDLGTGRFAFYAHLQPGSIKVKVGDKVRRGQVLGLVGNSGNSTEPHLHFHVTDAASPLGSEGVPYVLDSFEVLSNVASGPRTNALPLENMRVKFADAR